MVDDAPPADDRNDARAGDDASAVLAPDEVRDRVASLLDADAAEPAELDGGFFVGRRAAYRLYPLLENVRLFGGRSLPRLDETLSALGY